MATSRGRWASPERTVVWTEPPPKTASFIRRAGGAAPPTKVAVVYYLSRNGQLDHPHFMEVTLSSPQDGLCLRAVLNNIVGNASASSSSSSTSSRQGNDGNRMPPAGSSRAARRKNWSSFDLGEYRVAAAVQMGGAADAATQTDDTRRGGRRRNVPPLEQEAARTELGSDEISPPPSSSSPDTLETLIKHDARLASATVAAPQPGEAYAERREDVGVISGGRMRASAVLMQLISCGSIPAPAKREGAGPSRHVPRGRSDLSSSSSAAEAFSGSIGVGIEREYFSGSLVETKRSPALGWAR